MKQKYRTIVVPVHPDEAHIPRSTIYVPLPSGKIATLYGPLGLKTLGMVQGALEICKDAFVEKPKDDFSI